MGKLGMVLSLDGYVAGVDGGPLSPPPGATLHRHFKTMFAAWPASCTVVACTR